MKIELKNKYLIFALLIAITGTFLLGKYFGRVRAEKASEHTINTLNGLIKEYVIDINGLKKQVSDRQQLILTQKQAIDIHLAEKSKLKNLQFKTSKAVTSLKSEIAILKDSLSHTEFVFIVEPCDSIDYSLIRF